MSMPTDHGLPCASYGSGPSVRPANSDGEQLAHEMRLRARLFFAVQSLPAKPLMRPAYSHQPLPCEHESPQPAATSPFLHVVSKLSGPVTSYLLVPSESIMPCSVTMPAMRLCTPQLYVPTPPGPVFDATSPATRPPVLWPTMMMFFFGDG